MTLQEAKSKLEETIREVQAGGDIEVIGWADGCVSVNGSEDLEIRPKELLPAPPA